MAKLFKKNVLKTSNDARTQASQLTLRQSIYPLVLVTILFFLWGFSYGLLDTLNKHFQNVLGITRARSAGLQAAYFGAYPLASLGHANWLLRHYGYKVVFIWGLCLYAVGALVAWPCLLYKSFGGFCAAIFIIGNGLGSLETAANPFITVCGPPKYAEMRINLSQAFNGIGTVIAPVLGSYVFFNDIGDDVQSLRTVQWVYLAMACFTFLLAIVFYFSPIPEITDADMEFQAEESQANPSAVQPFSKQYRLFHASFAQFCYTGSQVAIATFFINYVKDTRPGTSDSTAARFLSGAQAAFAVGRFVGVALMRFIRPRWIFLVYMTMCIVFLAPTITQRGDTGMIMLYLTLFWESIIFATIVALGMRGLGKHSKRGSGFIIAGVSGGAVVSPAMGAAADARDVNGHGGTAIAMAVPLGFFLVPLSYAICVNFVPAYRDVIDRTFESTLGLQGSQMKDVESGSGTDIAVGKEKGASVHAEHRDEEITSEMRKM